MLSATVSLMSSLWALSLTPLPESVRIRWKKKADAGPAAARGGGEDARGREERYAMMTVEEAIKTAIEFETNVRDVYRNAVNVATDPVGKRVFNVLADEEEGHLAYLNHRLEELTQTGRITLETLATSIPSETIIRRGVSQLKSRIAERDKGTELELLRKAYDMEEKTSTFYRRMVAELSAEGQSLFKRFVEIEEGHLAIVQAEIDYLKGSGYWFDYREFGLEGG
jgi:rubrerythrin